MSKYLASNPDARQVGKVTAIVALAGVAGYGAYYWLSQEGVIPCKPGDTKCKDYGLYTCSTEGEWVLTEADSAQCGYEPDEWSNWHEELGKKEFSVNVLESGWNSWYEELGKKGFSVNVIESGWSNWHEKLGEKGFSVNVLESGWNSWNEELDRKSFSVEIKESVGETYTLTTAVATPAVGWVSKSPDKNRYAFGEIVTITAHLDNWASGSYRFSYWDCDDEWLDSYSPINFMVSDNHTLTAHFRLKSY